MKSNLERYVNGELKEVTTFNTKIQAIEESKRQKSFLSNIEKRETKFRIN